MTKCVRVVYDSDSATIFGMTNTTTTATKSASLYALLCLYVRRTLPSFMP
jgi:hypothetical protein